MSLSLKQFNIAESSGFAHVFFLLFEPKKKEKGLLPKGA